MSDRYLRAFACAVLLLMGGGLVDVAIAGNPASGGDTILIYNSVRMKIYGGNGSSGAGAGAAAGAAAAPKVDSVEEYDIKPVIALRTNLLVPLLNVGVQIPIGNRFSIGADWYYPFLYREWSDKLAQTNCFQALGPGLDFRVYLGKKHRKGRENWQYRLSGHSIGIYGMVGRYDVEWDFNGGQARFLNAGIDYMYSAKIGKRKRLRLDLSIGAGYFVSRETRYHVFRPGGKAYRTGVIQERSWIGPNKATVSLVIPINKKVRREEK